MPLRDHFHLPLRGLCSWESFHSGWANEIMRQLNKTLPAGYVARPNVKLGVDVEADVGTLEMPGRPNDEGGGLAVAVWAPPEPTLTTAVDFFHLDLFEVQVHREGGLEMVAAVELVSPRNKDRPTARRHFASKCAAYLQAGVSVILVDVVTTRKENLYAALLDQLSLAPDDADEGPLYAVACRSTPPDEASRLECWVKTLQLGSSLPVLPLWLESDLAVPLNLEKSYEATFVELRVAI
ncbi:MAG TPA: DUF4058 domain-containing protein [Planctomycetales bacterium]|jgi:hypothetical protein|nr:DUF4058 domain-containing protein [Planctomycetales bacterium]